MDSIAVQILELYSKADEEERGRIQTVLRDLQTSIDTEWDVLMRMGSGVSLFSTFCLTIADYIPVTPGSAGESWPGLEHLCKAGWQHLTSHIG
jgi:hypothetical protein